MVPILRPLRNRLWGLVLVRGVNEVLAVLPLAAKFGVPVGHHAGGDGLCELVQRQSVLDHVRVSGQLDGRMQPETLSRFAFAAGAEWAIGK